MNITIEPLHQNDIPVLGEFIEIEYFTSPINVDAMRTNMNIYINFITLALEKLGSQTCLVKDNGQIGVR